MATTIQISDSIKKALLKMKLVEKDSYNDVLERMIEDNLQLNAQTKREIEEARIRIKSGKSISMEAVARKFGA